VSNRRKLSQRKASREYTMPSAISALVDRQMLADAAYFRQHPDVQRYALCYVPGETRPNVVPADTVAEVTQLPPGVRCCAVGFALMVADFDKIQEQTA